MILLARIGRIVRIGREFFERLSDGTLPAWVPIMFGLFGMVFVGLGVYQIRTRRVVFTGKEDYRGWSASAYGILMCVAGGALIVMSIIGQFAGSSTPVAQRQEAAPRASMPRADVVAEPEEDPARADARNELESQDTSQPRTGELDRQSEGRADALDATSRMAELQDKMRGLDTDASAGVNEDAAPLVLGEPEMPLPPIDYTAAEIRPTVRAGDEHGELTYDQRAPTNGLLVGMRVAIDASRGDSITGLQPIYQVAEQYKLGAQVGRAEGRIAQVLAKPGYAVGRLDVREGFSIDGLRLGFFRVEGASMASDDAYESEWFGREQRDEKQLAGGGDFIVGVFGSAEREVRSLGLYFADQFGRRLGSAAIPFPELRLDAPTSVAATDPSDEQTFRDMASPGAALVGLRVALSDDFGGAVKAIQPIYQLADTYQLGEWCGIPGGVEHTLLAKPGFAVARINARSGLVVDAIQLQFARLERGRLDAEDAYESEWIGGSGGSTRNEPTEPALIVGVSGKAKESIESLTYYAAAPESGRSRRGANRAAESAPPVEEPRTWTSASGGHTVEATLLRTVGPQIMLRDSAGKEIKVPLEKLSEADQEHVRQWRAKRRAER